MKGPRRRIKVLGVTHALPCAPLSLASGWAWSRGSVIQEACLAWASPQDTHMDPPICPLVLACAVRCGFTTQDRDRPSASLPAWPSHRPDRPHAWPHCASWPWSGLLLSPPCSVATHTRLGMGAAVVVCVWYALIRVFMCIQCLIIKYVHGRW